MVDSLHVTEVKLDQATGKYEFFDGRELHFDKAAFLKDLLFVLVLTVGVGILVERRTKEEPRPIFKLI